MHDEFDLLIGVTAIENKLTLVTDNAKDFNPWTELKLKIGSRENSTNTQQKIWQKCRLTVKFGIYFHPCLVYQQTELQSAKSATSSITKNRLPFGAGLVVNQT